MNPINTFGLLSARRRAVEPPNWMDDTIHYDAPEAPVIEDVQANAAQPQPMLPAEAPPVRRSALYRYALKRHDDAVRSIQRQSSPAAEN